jgi:mono/diheme cytochrome c family protein
MKRTFVLSFIFLLLLAFTHSLTYTPFEKGVHVPASPQYPGDAVKGYEYLVTGDYLKSGIPLRLFNLTKPKVPDYLQRGGINAGIPHSFTAIHAPNGVQVAAPNCLFCHAQEFEGQLVIGQGNSLLDFSKQVQPLQKLGELALKVLASEKEQAAAANLLTSGNASAPYLVTASAGVNIADRLTAVLASHRDPASFKWLGKPAIPIPAEVIPTDVPAWWLLKKKNSMFYTGFGRGDFPRFLMAANLLTVSDTAEAASILPYFDDVLAFIYSLQPPRYPQPIDEELARSGQVVFEKNCSKCHGTYGPSSSYPNLLIPLDIIKTDSALANSNFSSSEYLHWFQQSWFRQGPRKADLVPFRGYIAPPLDGVWSTAPYLHNGSVPDLQSLLNSKERPTYWERDFKRPTYNYQRVGWQYRTHDKQVNRQTYNTTLRGYSNAGHYFGDHLTDAERKAVIEYLKTL